METALPKMTLDRNVLSNLEKSISLEWVVANGLGGYASSTILGVNTRKYHGLLVPSFNPPVDRRVVLSKVDEHVLIEEEAYPLGTNEFIHGFHPQGYRHLEGFSQSPLPTYTYDVGDVKIHKTVLMPYKKNATIIIYEAATPMEKRAILLVSPLVNSRHFHAVTDKDKLALSFVQKASAQKTTVQIATPQSTLVLSSSSGRYIPGEKWVEDLYYRVDKSLDTSCFDDCFVPGMFETGFDESTRLYVVAAADQNPEEAEKVHASVCEDLADFNGFLNRESRRLTALLKGFQGQHKNIIQAGWLRWLVLAAASFIVNRFSTKTKTVIAGYHWFEDWGRDSLISLPGLALVTGRFDDAREVLLTFKHYCSRGIIPNRFPDEAGEQPVYDTVDATLWYFHAVLQYLKYTGDDDFVRRELWSILQSVIDYHIQGTINNIRLDSDGLIAHGPRLTWMDAMVNNNPATPREGKAVEIQALWYNALKVMELLANRFGQKDLAEKYRGMAGKAEESLVEKFWNAQHDCLFDVVNGDVGDSSMRPNQILAVSLDFSMLDKVKQASIVSAVHEKLWTAYGLRTLSPDDPRYRGRYEGGWADRDYAYHNGTAWPWLIGPFVTAFLKVRSYAAEARRFAFKNFLKRLFEEQTMLAGLGTLSELFDGDQPHAPGGCIAQAWSVAEPLRAYVEDVLLERPNFERSVLEAFSSTGR
jgi:predicted glycogen debranching enzyme